MPHDHHALVPPSRIVATLVAILPAFFAAPTSAATWSVDSTADAADAVAGDGRCADALGRCTLRAAIATAESGDEVLVPAGEYLLDHPLEIDRPVIITGDGADVTRLSTGSTWMTGSGALVSVSGSGSGSHVLRGLGLSHWIPEVTVQATGVSLTLQDCRIALTRGAGISMDGGALQLERCEITLTPGPAVRVVNSDLVVTDSNISGNGCCGTIHPGVGIIARSFGSVNHVRIERSVINDNRGLDNGGGIHLDGVIAEIADCEIAGNGGGPGSGGILAINGTELVMRRCLVFRNASPTGAGGIHVVGARAHVSQSTIAENAGLAFGADGGGGIGAIDAEVVLVNVTLSANRVDADHGGAAIRARDGAVVLVHSSTIVPPSTAFGSQVMPDASSTLRLANSVVAGAEGLSGTIESLGWNIVEDPHDGILTGVLATTVTGIDPRLAALADNGGGIPTHLPRAGSPVLDFGDPSGCLDEAGAPIVFDARGESRGEDGDEDGISRCDLGSVELQPADPRLAPPGMRLRFHAGAIHVSLIGSPGAAPALAMDIARGSLARLRVSGAADAACVARGVTEGEWVEPQVPDGDVYWLASSVTASDLGDWGTDSFGFSRPACP